MNKSTGDIAKRRKPRPPATGAPVLVRLQPADLALLDAYVASREESVSRPQALRDIMSDWLRTHGFGPRNLVTSGPATDVVEAMDAAIEEHRKSKRKR